MAAPEYLVTGITAILFVSCALHNTSESLCDSDNESFSQNIPALSFHTLATVCLGVWIIFQTAYGDRLSGTGYVVWELIPIICEGYTGSPKAKSRDCSPAALAK